MSVYKMLCSDRLAEEGRQARRSFPIHCYVGKNGSGKSLSAVFDTLPTLEAGRPVLSTVRLTDYENPRPCEGWDFGWERIGLPPQRCSFPLHDLLEHNQSHPGYIHFMEWRQLLDFTGGDVLMDEITGVADSTDSSSLPPAVKNKLPQLRRDDVSLRITSLSWIRVHKRIREACQAVTRCRGTAPVPRKESFGAGRMFRPNRISVQTTYDALSLPADDHTDAAYEKADVRKRSRLWIPECPAIDAYDTFAPVSTVGTVDDVGRCVACGGTRRVQECTCSDYLDGKAERKASVARHGDGGTPSRSGSGRHRSTSSEGSCGCLPAPEVVTAPFGRVG